MIVFGNSAILCFIFRVLSLGRSGLIVSTSARLVSRITCNVLMGTLILLTHSLTHSLTVVNVDVVL